MPMLTSLKLKFTRLEDEDLNELIKCLPNLQVLTMVGVRGLRDPMINHMKLIFFRLISLDDIGSSLSLITPNLITLRIECFNLDQLVVEAPMLSNLYLAHRDSGTLIFKKFENLKTMYLHSLYPSSLLSEFPITKTIENLTLEYLNRAPIDTTNSKLTLQKVITVFPNVNYLCIKSNTWSELETCLIPEGLEILDGWKGLKKICVYLTLVDPSLTFSTVACLLDHCVSLLEVSLLMRRDVDSTKSKSLMSKFTARWPGLRWRWGLWSYCTKDSWITDDLSNHLTNALVIR